jgi:hypothetical protein
MEELVIAGFAATPEGMEDVDVLTPEDDDALAGAGGWHGVKVLLVQLTTL